MLRKPRHVVTSHSMSAKSFLPCAVGPYFRSSFFRSSSGDRWPHWPQFHTKARSQHLWQVNVKSQSDESLEQLASKVKDNIVEGEFGTRGEAWVAGQAALLIGVLVAPKLPGFVSILLGLLCVTSGGALAAGAAFELGSSLTPWPKPVDANELKADGIYSLSRHPIYGGLIV